MKRLDNRIKQGNYRTLTIRDAAIDFASNDYLGLARSKELADLVRQEFENHETPLNGYGSTGSRLLSGNSQYAMDLESAIAAYHGYKSGLLFSCGYMANIGLLSAVAEEETIVLYDAQIHASTRDGIRLSRAKGYPFRHNDTAHLEKRLQSIPAKRTRLICIESYYSTDGSIAPIEEIVGLAKKYDALLIVDEAHAVGVCGPQGRGLVAEKKLNADVFAQVVTFGKAMGTYGAIALGDFQLKEKMINFSTPYIYTTALPLQMMAAIKSSYQLLPTLDHLRVKLNRLIHLCGAYTPIHSIKIPGNEKVRQVADSLLKKGIDVRALMSPTVRRGEESLRICLHAFNTEEELALLQHALRILR